MIDSFELLPFTRSVFEIYSSITRHLRKQGQLIGSNDLWIAANTLEQKLPLVTRNVVDFQRVPGLDVLAY
jgi:tRNA(fMet)-specific endonuclease VapC